MNKAFYMKGLAALFLLLLPLGVKAQRLADKGFSLEEIVPQGWTSTEATGDLNKDGISDLVVIALPDNEENLIRREDGYVYNLNQPVLAVYFGKAGEGFVCWRQYPKMLLPQPDEFLSYNYSLEITPRGTLIISVEVFASAGGWASSNYSSTYRYQKGDFFLIGQDEDSYARNTGKGEKVSRNYLTHKCQRVKYNVFDEKKKPVESWSKIPAAPLKKLGDVEFPYEGE